MSKVVGLLKFEVGSKDCLSVRIDNKSIITFKLDFDAPKNQECKTFKALLFSNQLIFTPL